MSKICYVALCSKIATRRGLCQQHYDSWRRLGSFEQAMQPKGSWSRNAQGYLENGSNGKRTYLHRYIAEQAIGKPLPPKAEVHHLNGERSDNRASNLVVCPDRAYHMLLERRQRNIGWFGPSPVKKSVLPPVPKAKAR